MSDKRMYAGSIRLDVDNENVTLTPAEGNGPRRFSMLGYTGAAVERPWGRMVIDLEGMSVGRQKKPILLGHDIERPVGHSEKISKGDKGLSVEGIMSGCEDADRVAKMSDQGFPWQASVGLKINKVVEYGEGEAVTVNGQEFTGPIDVVRKCALQEVSFCPLGADGDTSAVVLSNNPESMVYVEKGEIEMADEKKPEEIERERFAALRAAFPQHLEFAAAQFESGASVEQAKVAFCDVVAKERDDAQLQLKAKDEQIIKLQSELEAAKQSKPAIPGAAQPAAFTPPAEGNVTFADKVAEKLKAGKSQAEAITLAAKENPGLYEKSIHA